MGLAFELAVTGSVAARVLNALSFALPAAGLAMSAASLFAGPVLPLDGAPSARVVAGALCALGALLAVLAAARALRRGRTGPSRSLAVDAEGSPWLRDGPADPPRAMSLSANCGLPGLTIVVLAPYLPQASSRRPGSPVVLLLGRDGSDDEAWRRLHVWLHWMDRGRRDRSAPAPD